MTEEFPKARTPEEIIADRISQLMYLYQNYDAHFSVPQQIDAVIDEVKVLFKSIKPLSDELEKRENKIMMDYQNAYRLSEKYTSTQIDDNIQRQAHSEWDNRECEKGQKLDMIEIICDITDGYQLIPKSNPTYGIIVDKGGPMKFKNMFKKKEIPHTIKVEQTELELVQQKIKALEEKLKGGKT